MAYTILIGNDGSIYGSHKEKIYQREKLFNKLWFLVEPYYHEYDISECVVTMRYLLPISREFKTETLVLSEERYKDYLKYELPIDSSLTKEFGDIEFNLTFTLVDSDRNGNITQHVRKTSDGVITVSKINDWDAIIPDSSLAALDQRIIAQTAQIMELKNLANTLESQKVDNLVYNEAEDVLHLASQGKLVGDKLSVRDILDEGVPVIDLNSGYNSGGSDSNNNNNCGHDDCDCHDNVVEFGYESGYNPTPEKPEDDDSNVVEF